MVKALYRVQKINNPILRGKPLLLLPEGLLVRWPDRVPMPEVGDWFAGIAVTVPIHLRAAVLTVLFGASPLERCDAAKRIAQNKEHRRRILSRLFGKSMVQKMITSAERLDPAVRAQLAAMGDLVALRHVFKVAYSTTSTCLDEPARCTAQMPSHSSEMDRQDPR